MVDILILYEHRTREIENVALLKAELLKRGYSVRVENIYSPWLYYIQAKVVIVPHLYNNQQLNAFCNNYKHNNHHIIDLQYEQVLNDSGEDGIHNPKGEAAFAHHIAWGESQYNRYVTNGISPNNVHETGCISMDLFMPMMNSYFLSKEDISKQFGLDGYKEWVLFISSLSFANRTEKELLDYERINPFIRSFANISDSSYNLILQWLKKAANQFPEIEFIYRPHPAERMTKSLIDLETGCPNIHIIRDLSMRQWAKSCDKVYNWFSTSVVDVYYAGKPCYILRPIDIPDDLEVAILKNAEKITDFNKFESTLKTSEYFYPVPTEDIEFFYGNRKSRMAFLQIADICEKMIGGIIPEYHFKYEKRDISFRHIVSRITNGILFIISKNVGLPTAVINILGRKAKLATIFKNDVSHIDKELNNYTKRFSIVIKTFK